MLYDEIIRNRQSEIFNEVQELTREIERLTALKERRIAEHKMLDTISDRGLFDSKRGATRVHIEDAIKRIFERAGKPMRIGQLIKELEEFGYTWSAYPTAYYHISQLDILQHTGAQGYYNIIRY